jgi:hypothetical protein
MRNLIKILLLTIFAAISIFAQDNFVSADGGFAIDLPKTFTTSKDYDGDYLEMFTKGKTFSWQISDAEPFYMIQYMKYQTTDFGKTLVMSVKLKNNILKNFGKELADKAKEISSKYKEIPYSFNGNVGIESVIYNNLTQSTVRTFFVKNTFYSIAVTFSMTDDKNKIKKTLDSFRLLARQEIIDIKVKQAEPKPLPQTPVSDNKKTTDLQDNNLKGKVKFIVEDYQETPNKKREKWAETFYNEIGNLTRLVAYSYGRPDRIEVWGYIDGNRVSDENSTDIHFEDEDSDLTQAPDVAFQSLPKDERYGNKYIFKYNDKQQLIEKTTYFNNGELYTRENYVYKDNRRETTTFHAFIEKTTNKSIQIYDKNGDLIEETNYDYQGKFFNKTSYKYELDTKGNWIVQKSFDNVKVKGKTVLKPSSIIYRAITYYD